MGSIRIILMDSSGFYKNENGLLLAGPHFVLAGSYNLFKEEKDSYTYPIGGWYWFDSIEEACAFFQLEIPQWYIDEIERLNNG